MSDFQSMSTHYHYRDYFRKRHGDCLGNHNCDMTTFAERLLSCRIALNMTQAELARAAGLKNQSIIGSLETGYRKSTSYTPALAAALGVSALWLSTGKGDRSQDAPCAAPTAYPKAFEANEPAPENNLMQLTVEARAKVLAEQAGEVAALWMNLPADRREKLLKQLRTEAGRAHGDALVLKPRKSKPGTATSPDTTKRREAD